MSLHRTLHRTCTACTAPLCPHCIRATPGAVQCSCTASKEGMRPPVENLRSSGTATKNTG
jgi:hypothetical protein